MAITLKTGNGGKDGFQPTTDVGNGKMGLKKGKSTFSSAKLFGTGLKNNLVVRVDHNPSGTINPKHLWTGFTSGSTDGGKRCRVVLTQWMAVRRSIKKKKPRKKIRDDDITVSVTATDTSTGETSNTIKPRVPSGP
jgi:hypothetical protein